MSEVKTETYTGKVIGVSDVKEIAKKDGSVSYKVSIKGESNDWYGSFDNAEACENIKRDALTAKTDKSTVVFEYTRQGRWFNITDFISWNLNDGQPPQETLKQEGKAFDKHKGKEPTKPDEPIDVLTQCVIQARKAWELGVYGKLLGELDSTDKECIQKLATAMFIDENRRK